MNTYNIANSIDLFSSQNLLYLIVLIITIRKSIAIKLLCLIGITIFANYPLYMQTSVVYMLRGIIGVHSITTLIVMIILSVKLLFRLNFIVLDKLSSFILIGFGCVLYLSTLGFLPFSLYDLGFTPNVYTLFGLLLILLLILHLNKLLAILFLVSFIAYYFKVQSSVNLFDYLFSPILWFISIIYFFKNRFYHD